jgi:hypothetical protein
VHLGVLNVQDQAQVTWPPSFVVARAYLDQLHRDNGLSSSEASRITQSLQAAERLAGQAQRTALTKLAREIETATKTASDPRRVHLLAADIVGLANHASPAPRPPSASVS